MGFGLYSVKDPSRYAVSTLSGAGSTASRMDKATQIVKPGPTVGGAIATGVAGAIAGGVMGKDIGLKRGLPKTAQPGKPGATAMAHQLETAETAKAGMRVTPGAPAGASQSRYKKYGAGAGAITGMLAHLLS